VLARDVGRHATPNSPSRAASQRASGLQHQPCPGSAASEGSCARRDFSHQSQCFPWRVMRLTIKGSHVPASRAREPFPAFSRPLSKPNSTTDPPLILAIKPLIQSPDSNLLFHTNNKSECLPKLPKPLPRRRLLLPARTAVMLVRDAHLFSLNVVLSCRKSLHRVEEPLLICCDRYDQGRHPQRELIPSGACPFLRPWEASSSCHPQQRAPRHDPFVQKGQC
jgi:hypothetical protein